MSFQEQIDDAIKKQELYFIGDSLPADWYAGFKQWLPLAEGGDAKAAFNVGTCYLRGDGVDRSGKTALDWYRRAADLGDTRAMLALYEQLNARTPAEAEDWLQRAVAAGDPRSVRIASERDRERTEQARKAQEREDHQAMVKRSAPLVAELKALLERGDNAGARHRAEQAVQEGFAWAGSVVAATSLQLNVHRTSRKRYTVMQGASMTTKVVSGVYQTTPVSTSHREYTFKGTVTNPTAYVVDIDFGEPIGSRMIAAGGSKEIARSESMTEKWPVNGTLYIKDPNNTKVKMVLKRSAMARPSGGGGKVWKIVGGLVVLYVLVKAYHLWQAWEIYERFHGG
ncbi:sel1 repeat family protein, partial [Burkholderia gladioli]